jgi:hypothetical protein
MFIPIYIYITFEITFKIINIKKKNNNKKIKKNINKSFFFKLLKGIICQNRNFLLPIKTIRYD